MNISWYSYHKPQAWLHIFSNNGIISRGTLNQGAILNETGPGSLFIFNPRKGGAIRAGYLSQAGVTNWDNASTGHFSIGLGYDAKATGEGSVAIGQLTAATGTNATAIGYGCGAEIPNLLTMHFVQ